MNYHPDIDFLLKYSSGQLEPALAVAIGVHLQDCPTCKQQVIQLEEVGGVTLESASGEFVNDEFFDKLLSDVEDLAIEKNVSPFEECAVAEMDRPIMQQLSERNYENLEWEKVTKNIARATVAMNDPRYQVELLRFQPRAKIPKHTHSGSEFTLVLEGDFSDKDGTYKVGEFIVNDSTVEHQPLAGDEGCVCLAITDAPLKFTGTFGPIINWWIK